MPKTPRWPRWALLLIIVAVITRITLKDLEMGWSRALQIYFFSILSFLLAMLFGLGRWLTARPTREQIMARLGLVTNILTIHLDEDGVSYGEVGLRRWSEFNRFTEDKLAFVLHGAELLQVLPKRAFSLDELDLARELMLRKVVKAA